MLIISGAALTRNSVYLLIGDLLFQYCMQIGLLMWDMLLAGLCCSWEALWWQEEAQPEATVQCLGVYQPLG